MKSTPEPASLALNTSFAGVRRQPALTPSTLVNGAVTSTTGGGVPIVSESAVPPLTPQA